MLVLAAMPSFQLEDVRCRLSSSSKIVGLLPGYCAVAWKTVWSLSQNLYCWVSQIITPEGYASQNSIRECEREKRMNLIIREYCRLELQNSWCILVFFVSFVKSLNLVMVACRLPTTLDVQQVNFNFTRE